MSFGERLKSIRKENKMTQQDFASEFGISQTHVSKLEKEVERPSDTLLKFISYRFAINFDWLKNGTGEKYVPGGASAEGTINIYYRFRQKYEKLFAEFNTDQLWLYVDAYMYFVNCITYAEDLNYSNYSGEDYHDFYLNEKYLRLFGEIQKKLWYISCTFYDKDQKKGKRNVSKAVLEAKQEKCIAHKEAISAYIDQIISDGLDFLIDNKNP